MSRPSTALSTLLRLPTALLLAALVLGGGLELHPQTRRDAHRSLETARVAADARHPHAFAHLEHSPIEQVERCSACLMAVGGRGVLDPPQGALLPTLNGAVSVSEAGPDVAGPRRVADARGPPPGPAVG